MPAITCIVDPVATNATVISAIVQSSRVVPYIVVLHKPVEAGESIGIGDVATQEPWMNGDPAYPITPYYCSVCTSLSRLRVTAARAG
jgi:hypothetical protein